MAIAKGTSLGPYEILAPIGQGGMGEVWRARDRRIGRDVAVKVLPGEFPAGDERLWRFEQEARAAGGLNHPGLVTIFDVGTRDGAPYIVMELLEGDTLRDVIGSSSPAALPLRKAMNYAVQIASALAVAHDKGIIHRDLKPENLFVMSDGRIKILDFGLAKLAPEAREEDESHRTARHVTSAGMAVGTPGYMSPEQVRAQPIDHRTDIFSFGSVLYEMLSGQPAFEESSAVETMHAVLNADPTPLSVVVPATPPMLEAIVARCIEKSPPDRFQSARDLAFQLRMLSEVRSTDAGKMLPASKRKLPPYAIAIAALALLGAGAGGFVLFRGRDGSSADPRTLKQLTFADGLEMFPSLAPDGKSFAYVSSQSGNRDVYVQRVDGRGAMNITSDSKDDDSEPVFSPNGSQIAFRSERDGGGIFVMGVTGESVIRLTDVGHNPSWSPDGTRLVVSTAQVELEPHVHGEDGSLWIVDARTGAKRLLLQARKGAPGFGGDIDALQPSWSPHGQRIAFWGVGRSARRDIWTIDPNAPRPNETLVRVTTDAGVHWNPVWAPDGKHLHYGSNRDGTLNFWRIPMDENAGVPVGTPELLSLPAAVSGHYTIAQNGAVAFTSVVRSDRIVALSLESSTHAFGAPRLLFGGSQEILTFEPSPDGKSIAFTTGGIQEDVFVANADGTRLRQLTNDAARDRGVTWSPDGKTLYFYSNRDSGYHIWSIRADGSGLTRITDNRDYDQMGNMYWPHVSPGGRTLVADTEEQAILVHLDRHDAQRIQPIGNQLLNPSWSPDGRSLVGVAAGDPSAALHPAIAVYSLETRRLETFENAGIRPQWLTDGRRIAFIDTRGIGIVDLESRRVTNDAFALPAGIQLQDSGAVRLSNDGATLYLCERSTQGDIWLLNANEQSSTRFRPDGR